MIDLKKEQLPTCSSAFLSGISPLEGCVVQLDREQRTIKACLEKGILCPSRKQVGLLARLLTALSASKLFEGTVMLEDPQEKPPPSALSAEEEPPRHRVCYAFAARCDPSDFAPANAQVYAFLVQCEALHKKLEEFVKKYRIQNRINYWMYQLGEALRGRDGRSSGGREGRLKEEEMDREFEAADTS